MRSRSWLPGSLLAVAAVLAGPPTASTASAEIARIAEIAAIAGVDINDLEEISHSTFRIDPDAGVVRVEVTVSLRNLGQDEEDGDTIIRPFVDGYGFFVSGDAENVEAVSVDGTVLTTYLEPAPITDLFAVVGFDLPTRLHSGDATTVTVTYDLPGAPPRSDIPWRANEAYSFFAVFGNGDAGRISIDVVVPHGFDLDWNSEIPGFRAQPPDAFGAVTYSATGLDDEDVAWFSVIDPSRLVETPLTVGEATFVLASWPDDADWGRRTAARLERTLPILTELMGSDWPLEQPITVREAYASEAGGYGGWYYGPESLLEYGEDPDPYWVYNTVARAWLGWPISQKWLLEGLADVYAVEVARQADDTTFDDPVVDKDHPDRLPLTEWGIPADDGRNDDYAYTAASYVVDAIVDDIGFDGMQKVLTADNGRLLYGEPDEPARRFEGPLGWTRTYDLFEIVGGATDLDALFREYVIPPRLHGKLDDRADARAAYDELREAARPWSVPLAIRQDMDAWRFGTATKRIEAAAAAITRRDEVAAIAGDTGITPPDLAAEPFAAAVDDYSEVLAILDEQLADGQELAGLQEDVEAASARVGVTMPPIAGAAVDRDGFVAASAIARDRLDALDAVAEAIDAEAARGGLFERVGRLGTDVQTTLDQAREALEAGATDRARELSAEAMRTLDAAEGRGRTRAFTSLGALAALVVIVVLLIVAARRRAASRRPPSGGGAVDALEHVEPLPSAFDLDEDALSWTGLGGVDHRLDVAGRHEGEAPRPAGIVERQAALGDVGDPVLELDEHVGAVVDAETVAGAEVLIDPDAHDAPER